MPDYLELTCPQCAWTSQCSPPMLLGWLRDVRQVRRDAEPEAEILGELCRLAAPRFPCPRCGHIGLDLSEPADEGNDEAWGMARKCAGCARPIPRQRLEVVPDARLCTACQAKSDRGELTGPAEYCPRCGSIMAVRQSRGAGITRYVWTCPGCRRQAPPRGNSPS